MLSSPESFSTLRKFAESSSRELRSWDDAFLSFTWEYPRLQFDGLPETGGEVLRIAQQAHREVLIHTFVDDRVLDGQIVLTVAESVFLRRLLFSALDRIATLASERRLRFPTRLQEQYLESQAMHFCCEEQEASGIQICRAVAGRAALGALAVMGLAEAFKCDGRTQRRIKNAYDCLVIGLQWVDDLEDWRQDLHLGADNLLLIRLKQSGLNPYSHPANTVRCANVGYALKTRGIVDLAIDRAERWFNTARVRQERLGCMRLASSISDMVGRLDAARLRCLSKIDDDIADAHALVRERSQTTSATTKLPSP